MSDKELLNGRLIVTTGDITSMKVDAIVNAANSSLMGGGGVDGAIHRAGGPAILEECREIRKNRYPGGLPAGDAVPSTAGLMPAKYVIHTVGPVWHGGNSGEPEKLAGCYRRSLEEAEKLNLDSIAFPAISTGIYGYPREKAARIAYDTVAKFTKAHEHPEKVYLVFYSGDDKNVFLAALGE